MALEKVMDISNMEEIAALLNKRVQVGQSSLFVVSYLDRASRRLNEAVLTKLCSALFAGFRTRTPILKLPCYTNKKQASVCRVDESRVYYGSSEYKNSWKNVCYAALTESISAGLTSCPNIR